MIVSCYGFKYLKEMGILKIPLGDKRYFDIMLTKHTMNVLGTLGINSGSRDKMRKEPARINSFTLTADNWISISYSKNIEEIECNDAAGLDRNLDNVTFGNFGGITHYKVSKATKIAWNTKSIYSSFKRNDVRIRRKFTSKYGKRRFNRVTQLLHKVSKCIVNTAREKKQAIVFEDIRDIRKLYQKGNWQGRRTIGRMNSWPFGEIKRQIEYKAKWLGIPTIQLTRSETYGTSSLCSTCGERTRSYKVSKQDSIEVRDLRRRQL
jgi:putative transposase